MKNEEIQNVKASLPSTVRRFTWVRNHHYVEMEDESGHTVKLHAGGVLRGECTKCHSVIFATTHQGAMICPHCLSPVKWQWSKIQLAFLPEEESKFHGFDAPQVDVKPLTVMQRAWLVFYAAITRQTPKAKSAPSPAAAEDVPGAFGAPLRDDEETPVPGLEPRGKA